jgi:hypothetical protein
MEPVSIPDDSRVKDLHRKFASIKHLFPEDRQGFLSGKCTGVFDDEMLKTVNAFKKLAGLDLDGKLDKAMFKELSDRAGVVFAEAWQFELEALDDGTVPSIARSAEQSEVITRAHRQKLFGLAFSGGGIRSATFNLGIIQAMSELKMLRDVHYLSTVSGGGYIGSWLSTLLHRNQGDVPKLERDLAPGTSDAPVKKEPDAIRFLRQYSNYLTPKTGMFSADSWALLATYFRNTFLNLTILVAIIAGWLVVPRILARAVAQVSPQHASIAAWIAASTVLWSVACIALSISSVPDPKRRQHLRGQTQLSILLFIVLPLMVSAFSASIAVWHYQAAFIDIWDQAGWPASYRHPIVAWVLLPGVFYFFAWVTGWGLAQLFNSLALTEQQKRERARAAFPWRSALKEGVGHFLCAMFALAVGSLLLTALVKAVSTSALPMAELNGPANSLHLVSMGIPFMLFAFGITMILAVGLVGRMYAEKSREWWSRQGGWTAICTISWLVVVGLSLYAPALVGYSYSHSPVWGKALVGSTWFGATAAGLLLGHSKFSGKQDGSAYMGWIAALAPLVFSLGALLLISTLAYMIIVPSSTLMQGSGRDLLQTMTAYYAEANAADTGRMLMVFGLLLLGGSLLALRVDVNKFSLYTMYRNRLVRAYLGAANPERKPHPFTGFDDQDDVHLDDLLTKDKEKKLLQKPIHILNATLNLVNGKELAWQTRKGANFTFTPAFCGFETPSMSPAGGGLALDEAARGCYRATADYRKQPDNPDEERPGIHLGMAMAVSGAAANPNMGFHSSPAMAFLMTLFNVRLGRWFANPLSRSWLRTSPRSGLHYLLAEVFGQTDAASDYLNLSDGGHFENLGIYELVRRRCRLIVVVDAGADGGLSFEDLGNAIRKCYTDLNIEIAIDVSKIDPVQPSPFSRAHCVAGKILYENIDGEENGVLLYIKPSLLGTEFADLLNYRKSNKSFPHHSTADQWFDESQFESYRALGHSIGVAALAGAAAKALVLPGELHDVATLCAALEAQWSEGAAVIQPLHVVTGP